MDRKAYRFIIRDWQSLSDTQNASDVMATMRFTQNLTPVEHNAPEAKQILVIAPHPDDETIGPGGTLLKALEKGSNVHTLYLSCGSPETTDNLRTEAQQIATTHGYGITFFDDYAKGIPIDDAAVQRFANAVNRHSPKALFIPFFLDDHDDHRRSSHLLLLAHRQGLLNIKPEIWAYQVYSSVIPNVVVDITSVAKKKEHLIRMWATQNTTRDWAHFALGMNAVNQRFLPNGPDAKYAETFFVLPIDDYVNYCEQYFNNSSNCYYHKHYKK